MEHTYHNRLTYLISKVLKETVKETSYSVCIVSVIKNQEEANRVCASYQRQSYEKTRCVLITEDEIHVPSEIETRPSRFANDVIVFVLSFKPLK